MFNKKWRPYHANARQGLSNSFLQQTEYINQKGTWKYLDQ